MTSKPSPEEAFVWIWLPGAVEPVVAGRIAQEGARFVFNYGQSYLKRADKIAIFDPELPLRRGVIEPPEGLTMAGALRDGAPDAWGRRVIINRLYGKKGDEIDVGVLGDLAYFLLSGSDRIGALDFQASATDFKPRVGGEASLEELLSIAARVEAGRPIAPELDQAVFHGSSIGGARPKAAIETGNKKFIAKFSSVNDVMNVVKAEFVAMRLAGLVGLTVAAVDLQRAAGKDVLLIERFDRERTKKGWARRAMASALTLFGLDEMLGRYGSYELLAEIIRARFAAPAETLRELYGRLVFNVLSGNTDDHARNHAAFWDGKELKLTPGYDICPQARTSRESNQAMLIVGDQRSSRIVTCLEAAPYFLLSKNEAVALIGAQIQAIKEHWAEVVRDAGLAKVEEELIRAQFLREYALEGVPPKLSRLIGRKGPAARPRS